MQDSLARKALKRCFQTLGVEATYRPQEGEPLKVKVLCKQQDQESYFSATRIVSQTVTFDLLAQEGLHPQRGDRILIEDKVFEVQSVEAKDALRLVGSIEAVSS